MIAQVSERKSSALILSLRLRYLIYFYSSSVQINFCILGVQYILWERQLRNPLGSERALRVWKFQGTWRQMDLILAHMSIYNLLLIQQMGNECNGSGQYQEMMDAIGRHKQEMRMLQSRLQEEERVLKERLAMFNQERENFYKEKTSFEKSRTNTTILEQAQQEDELENSVILQNQPNTSKKQTVRNDRSDSKPSPSGKKLYDFQFIVNYNFR